MYAHSASILALVYSIPYSCTYYIPITVYCQYPFQLFFDIREYGEQIVQLMLSVTPLLLVETTFGLSTRHFYELGNGKLYLISFRSVLPVALPTPRLTTRLPTLPFLTALASPISRAIV